jgi:hypothetical protein
MKTTIKQLAALTIFSIIFLTGNVSAKGNKAITASSLETTVETTLEMENWMVDEAIWNTNVTEIMVAETDSELELEGWMTDASNWKVAPQVVMETEAGLELENWMVCDDNWRI